MKNKHLIAIIAALILCAAVITGCDMSEERKNDIGKSTDVRTETSSTSQTASEDVTMVLLTTVLGGDKKTLYKICDTKDKSTEIVNSFYEHRWASLTDLKNDTDYDNSAPILTKSSMVKNANDIQSNSTSDLTATYTIETVPLDPMDLTTIIGGAPYVYYFFHPDRTVKMVYTVALRWKDNNETGFCYDGETYLIVDENGNVVHGSGTKLRDYINGKMNTKDWQ